MQKKTMRLINTTTLQLEEFKSSREVKYGILSHTWGDSEVTFEDMASSSVREQKKGWKKITNTCRLAKRCECDYAWVDTCCIDKSSSAELSESINSMFEWYANAVICFAYLEDLEPDVAVETWLPQCRWITRGWTLQELLAPREVHFFDKLWKRRGSKATLVEALRTSTQIDQSVLRKESRLSDYSVAVRMSWAANRETTRPEDMAYCLMGLFDINMPLLYGEGSRAFRRLQEEIARRMYDLTFLSWDDPVCQTKLFHGLFAPSPAAFKGMSDLVSLDWLGDSFSITNSGLRLTNGLHFTSDPRDGRSSYYALVAGYRDTDKGRRLSVVRLRKLDSSTFYRTGPLVQLEEADEDKMQSYLSQGNYVLMDAPVYTPLAKHMAVPRIGAIHIPSYIEILAVTPHIFWDVQDRVFLDPELPNDRGAGAVYAILARMEVRGVTVDVAVLFDRRRVPRGGNGAEEKQFCRIFEAAAYNREARWVFSTRWESDCLYWSDLEFQVPALLDTTNTMSIGKKSRKVDIVASLRNGTVPSISVENSVNSLCIEEKINAPTRG